MREEHAVQRSIPAFAGNTQSRTVAPTSRPVHPRMRGEHKAGKEKDDSYDSKVIGEDQYGNKVYGVINKTTGAITPVGPQG